VWDGGGWNVKNGVALFEVQVFLHAILPHPTPENCNLTNHRIDPAKSSINLVYIKMNAISSSDIV